MAVFSLKSHYQPTLNAVYPTEVMICFIVGTEKEELTYKNEINPNYNERSALSSVKRTCRK